MSFSLKDLITDARDRAPGTISAASEQISRKSPIVDFFIVGAPKCGTTALAKTLAQNRHIYIPPEKEVNYFCQDLEELAKASDLGQYEDIFLRSKNCLNGDASVSYLYSEKAAEAIAHYNANAKIIILLRHPVDFVASLHRYRIFTGIESRTDFELCWQMEIQYLANWTAQGGRKDVTKIYVDMARFAKQVARYLRHFPRNQVLLMPYDDWQLNPTSTLYRIENFLGVPHNINAQISQENVTRAHRSLRFARWWAKLAQDMPRSFKEVLSVLPLNSGRRIYKVVSQLNHGARLPRMPENIQHKLELALQQDIAMYHSIKPK